jgi:hypothetical protein
MEGYISGVWGPSNLSIIMAKWKPLCKAIVREFGAPCKAIIRGVLDPSWWSNIIAN